MKRIFLDDNIEFVNSIKENGDLNLLDLNPDHLSLYELIDVKIINVNNVIIEDDDIFFFNVNVKIDHCNRQSLKGIEFLIWIRIKGIMNHCVLYSFEALHSILNRKPQYLITSSEGTTFVHLPFDLISIDCKKLSKIKAKKENLITCLKSAFNVSAFRHRDANWWGVKCLWDVHRIVSNGKFKEEYPACVKEKFKELNNCVADYIFGIDDRGLNAYLKSFEKRLNEDIIVLTHDFETLNNEIGLQKLSVDELKEKWSHIKNEIERITTILRYTPNKSDESFDLVSAELETEESEAYAHDIQIFEYKKEEIIQDIDSIRSEIEKCLHILNKVHESINPMLNSNDSSSDVKKGIKILQIDDQAENGWADIMQMIVFGMKLPSHFKSIVPSLSYLDNIDLFYQDCVKNVIYQFMPSIILLDFRLFDESERSIDTEKISGRIILEKIRKDFISIPIIITSASNKIWTYETLTMLGADGYWIKEGIDEQRTAKETIENYKKLLELVSVLSSGDFKFLRNFSYQVQRMSKMSTVWWENHDWGRFDFLVPSVTNCNRDEVIHALNEIIILLRIYLYHTKLKSVYNPFDGRDWFYISLVLQHAGKIVELVHEYTDMNVTYSLSEIMQNRNDIQGWVIYRARNSSSHVGGVNCINWTKLQQLLFTLINWLTNPPPPKQVP